ncbi:hypothetical protein LTR50_006621 [Elasticomyces elasticus]|nr:hypothetical protein LTR50_006621 [Elasticomyces elasticus]
MAASQEGDVHGRVIAFTSQRQFHRALTLPATASHDKLRVTYSIAGDEGDEEAPVILYIGPLFGSRLQAFDTHYLASKIGVRIIYIERPGFGGSTEVPLHKRLPVWLETVPAVLADLRVKYVALVSHSAGTIYLLNTLTHLKNYLHPRYPFVAMMSEWHQNLHNSLRWR